jgi:hypothetical protein
LLNFEGPYSYNSDAATATSTAKPPTRPGGKS